VRGGEAGFPLGGDSRLAFGSSYGNAVASSGAGGVVDLSSNFVNLPALGQGGYSAATFAVSIFGVAANRFLNLELSALEADGKGKVVSSPRVVTADQIILQGPLKEVGLYTVRVKLAPVVEGDLKVWVVPSSSDAPTK
jgi:type IV pilus assembly protein PilQ